MENIFNLLNSFGINRAFLSSTFILTITIFVIYFIYIFAKFNNLRNKVASSFPKNQTITRESIEAEMLKQSPEYANTMNNMFLTMFKIFITVFVINILVTLIL